MALTDEANEARRAYRREWYRQHLAERQEYQREWYKKNPEKRRAQMERYWAKKAASERQKTAESGRTENVDAC